MKIVPFHISHLEAVAMLQQRIAEFPAKTMVDVLRWKQIENPMADAPLIVVGVDHGRVVATRTAYAMDWRFGNHPEPVRSAVFGGTVVAKSHEGQGLVRKMTDKLFALARARELAFGINLSPGRVVAGSSLRSGWVPVGPWDVLVRPKEGNQDAGQPVFPEPSECVSLSSRNGIGLCLGRGRYQEMAELDASCLHGNTISCWKTPEYFSWRLSNSITDYRVIYADRKGLQGYAVLGARKKPDGVFIASLIARSQEVAVLLLTAAVQRFGFRGLIVSSCSLTGLDPQCVCDLGFHPGNTPELLRRPYLLTDLGRKRVDFGNFFGIDCTRSSNWDASLLHTEVI